MSKGIVRNIFSDSIIYGVTKYLSVAASIFLTPIYTRILTKEDFGVMDIFNTWNTMITAILPLGLLNALIRFYPDMSDDKGEKSRLLGSIVTVFLITSLIYSIIMILLRDHYLQTFLEQQAYYEVFYYSLCIVFLNIFHAYILQLLRIKFKKYQYLGVTFTNFVILTILGFYLVYGLNQGISGFFLASTIALLCSNILGLFFISSELYLKIDLTLSKNLLSYSIHFIMVYFLFQASNVIDRYLINNYLDLDSVGVYSVAQRVGNILQIAIGAFGAAWMPYALVMKDKPGSSEIYAKMLELYTSVIIALVSVILFFRLEIIQFFAPDYRESYHTISLILILNFVMGLLYVFTIGIQITKKTRFLSIAAFFSIAGNFLISILLIGPYGINGVALGSIAGAVIWIGIQHYFSQYYYPIRFEYLKNSLIVLGLAVPLAGGYYIDQVFSGYMLIVMKSVISLGVIAALAIYLMRNKALKNLSLQ